MFLSFSANVSTLTQDESGTFTALLTDPTASPTSSEAACAVPTNPSSSGPSRPLVRLDRTRSR